RRGAGVPRKPKVLATWRGSGPRLRVSSVHGAREHERRRPHAGAVTAALPIALDVLHEIAVSVAATERSHLLQRLVRSPAVALHPVDRGHHAGPVAAVGAMDEHGLVRGVENRVEEAEDRL